MRGRSAMALIAPSGISPPPSRPRIPSRRPSMASATLTRRLVAPQARTQCPVTSPYALQRPRARHCSNIPRKQRSQCAGMGLLAPTTRPSIHPLHHLTLPHTRSGVFPPSPGLQPVDQPLRSANEPGLPRGDPGNDVYARTGR